MKIGDIVKSLITAENYNEVRANYNDEFIGLIKDLMPMYYDLIEEKEIKYQETVHKTVDDIKPFIK